MSERNEHIKEGAMYHVDCGEGYTGIVRVIDCSPFDFRVEVIEGCDAFVRNSCEGLVGIVGYNSIFSKAMTRIGEMEHIDVSNLSVTFECFDI